MVFTEYLYSYCAWTTHCRGWAMRQPVESVLIHQVGGYWLWMPVWPLCSSSWTLPHQYGPPHLHYGASKSLHGPPCKNSHGWGIHDTLLTAWTSTRCKHNLVATILQKEPLTQVSCHCWAPAGSQWPWCPLCQPPCRQWCCGLSLCMPGRNREASLCLHRLLQTPAAQLVHSYLPTGDRHK